MADPITIRESLLILWLLFFIRFDVSFAIINKDAYFSGIERLTLLNPNNLSMTGFATAAKTTSLISSIANACTRFVRRVLLRMSFSTTRSSVRGTYKRVEAGADADASQAGVGLERNRNGIHQR